MCGIAGVYEYGSRRPVAAAAVQAMLAAIAHRGPDDEGIHLDGELGIGNRRLSIIDLPGGRQPIANEDGTVTVAFNGEIYNFAELRRTLSAAGHVLRSDGDTEVLVHLYEQYGDAMVHRLRGMFAFAIWDARRRRLLLARDRLGIKPLYVADSGGRLLFGSEIKALLAYGDIDVHCDLDALAMFLLLKYVPAPQTMFAGVEMLPPGHLLVVEDGQVRIERWWDVSFAPQEPARSEAEAAQGLRELLWDAVSSHLVSDVPYGAFLSGGIDSSTIVALMSQILPDPVKTFAVGFKGAGDDLSELPYARLVAERYGTDHHEVLLGGEDLVEMAESVIWHLDQPIADNACLANQMVAALAADHVKMVLTGEGGDELFAGYARYSGERLSPLFRALPETLRRRGRAWASHEGLTRPRIALYALCERAEAARYASWFPLMHREALERIAEGDLTGRVATVAPERLFGAHLERTDARGAINRMLYVDTKLWLVDDLLVRGDKTSMANSLEARVPLLDHHLVEYAAGLPADLKVRGRTRKYLLREVARDWLPPEIITRPKQGFPIPVSHWLRGEARDFCHDLLAGDALGGRGLFRPAALEGLMHEHEAGTQDHGALLWALISIELWHRLYVDGIGRRAATPLAALG